MMEFSEKHEPPAGAGGPLAVSKPLDAGSELFPYGDHDTALGGASGGALHADAFSIGALLRCKWWILGVLVLVSGISLPCIWLFVAPQYKSAAIVRVSPVVSRIVFKNEDNGIVPLYRSYKNTQVSVIRSPVVLQRVLDSERVQQTSWYSQTPTTFIGDPPSRLERLLESLSVSPRKDSELIEIAMMTLVGKDGKVIVDTVVEEYKKYCDERMSEVDRRRLSTLKSELQTRQQEIEGLIATKFNVAKRIGTAGPEELRSQMATHLNALEMEYERVRREQAMTSWELEVISAGAEGTEEETASDDSESAESVAAGVDGTSELDVDAGQETAAPNDGDAETADEPDEADEADINRYFAADAEWRKLNIGLGDSRHELDLARQQFGDAHPHIQRLQANIGHAIERVAERETQLRDEYANGPANDLLPTEPMTQLQDRKRLAFAEQKQARQLELLKQEIGNQRAKVADAGDIAQDLAHYDEEIAHRRDIYEQLRIRLAELEMEGKAPARIEIASYAHESSRPARDRRLMLSVMAMGSGLMMGFAAAYLRSNTDVRIRVAGDVRSTVRVPFLGPLPALKKSVGLLSDGDPMLAESMRMVRTALLERLSGQDQRVVLITSSTSNAGKSSVAVLLGRSLARLGKRTLLVEADLRRPSLADRLSLFSPVGLAAMLTGQAKGDSGIISSGIPKLDVLMAGDMPDDFNAELLANGVFSACLRRWRKEYDYVLLDSPPVLPVADSRILAGQADGTIMVLRSSHCRRKEVVQAYADLSAAGGKLLGTVLVGVELGSQYGRYGDYYSMYGQEPRALESKSQA